MRLSFFGHNERVIQKAFDVLYSGVLIIYPTDTVYMPWVVQVTMQQKP